MLTDEAIENLVQTALLARKWAYTPYSHFPVGAALLTSSGKVYDGVNIENAAFPTTICAERVAVFKAVSEGERNFLAVAVVTEGGGSPCGSCRQVLAEFGVETTVVIANQDGKIMHKTSVGRLLPHPFLPEDLIEPI
jgi:cytidine deaminase